MRYLLQCLLLALPFPAAFAGQDSPDGLLRSLGVGVQGFTPAERAEIALGLARIPRCWQARLRGLRFTRSEELDGSSSDCTEGFYPGDGTIVLYPRCGFGAQVVVHETFHHLGRLPPLFLNQRWKDEVLKRIPRCPVSEYGADGLGRNNEDLAEAARILLVPESGDRLPDACVDDKLRALADLLNHCP